MPLIPDPVTGLTVAGAIGVAAKQLQDFMAAITGHPGESIGTILGGIAKRRLDAANAVGEKAHFTLLNIGVTPQAVPLPVLVPLLEGASLQEDPSMQDIWANLLANAANPLGDPPFSPMYADTLKGLGSREVRFLSKVYDHTQGADLQSPFLISATESTRLDGHFLQKLYSEAGLSRMENFGRESVQDGHDHPAEYARDYVEFDFTLAVCLRGGLIADSNQPMPIKTSTMDEKIGSMDHSMIPIETDRGFVLTHYGACFVAACRAPKKL